MKDKIYIFVIILALGAIIGQYVLYERAKEEMLANQEKMVEKVRKESQERIKAIQDTADAEVSRSTIKVNNLLKRNKILNAKIWNYENNPTFNDYDLYERARNIANYRYKAGRDTL